MSCLPARSSWGFAAAKCSARAPPMLPGKIFPAACGRSFAPALAITLYKFNISDCVAKPQKPFVAETVVYVSIKPCHSAKPSDTITLIIHNLTVNVKIILRFCRRFDRWTNHFFSYYIYCRTKPPVWGAYYAAGKNGQTRGMMMQASTPTSSSSGRPTLT